MVWRLRYRRPYLIFGWLWYLVALLPVIGLVQVGSQAMADRYSYVRFDRNIRRAHLGVVSDCLSHFALNQAYSVTGASLARRRMRDCDSPSALLLEGQRQLSSNTLSHRRPGIWWLHINVGRSPRRAKANIAKHWSITSRR